MKASADKIFWFLTIATGFVFVYVIAITFFNIPQQNLRFVDNTLGFLLGTVVSTSIAYYAGGAPDKKAPHEGTTTADISASITTDNNKS
ncbi:MAG TPA: hypothetical protein VL098_12665 [Flavipsychrobacter sp.]|nr:hypothetical protein [Flavipsychrobacter sp.]